VPRTGLRGLCALLALCAFAPLAHAAEPTRAHLRTHGVDPSAPKGSAAPQAHAAFTAIGWCGQERSHDDTADQVRNGRYLYHGIYMLPSDGQDRFESLASQLQASAFGASGLLESEYGRAIRFDMGTDCGPENLDISVVRTTLSSNDFEDVSDNPARLLGVVSRALSMAGFPTLRDDATRSEAAKLTTNYVVWLDAPSPAGCGAAQVVDDPTRAQTNWNNYGGKVAVLFPSGDGFCGEAAVRHEIGHTLGALQPDAPNAFDGMHCNDAYEDTMCYPSAPVRGSAAFEDEFFDYGNDDYWDPPNGKPLGWWTADLSRFICPTAGCNRYGSTSRVIQRPRSSRGSFRRATWHRAWARWRPAPARRG
jgi:hypothetical protein